MSFNKSNLIVEHHLNSFCTEEIVDHVAHIICTCGNLDFTFDGHPFSLKAGEAMIIVIQQLVRQFGIRKSL